MTEKNNKILNEEVLTEISQILMGLTFLCKLMTAQYNYNSVI